MEMVFLLVIINIFVGSTITHKNESKNLINNKGRYYGLRYSTSSSTWNFYYQNQGWGNKVGNGNANTLSRSTV